MTASCPELHERISPDLYQTYKITYNSYKYTLTKKTASDTLEIHIFFSVLTVASSFALGCLRTAAAQASVGV